MSKHAREDEGPGVPEALPRTLDRVGELLGPDRLDSLWIFPPLVKGRREWGLVVATCFAPDGERRVLHTARYSAERTGRGLELDTEINVQGEAPPDRFPRVVDGVVRRSGIELGDPREVSIDGDASSFQELMDEFDPALLEIVEP